MYKGRSHQQEKVNLLSSFHHVQMLKLIHATPLLKLIFFLKIRRFFIASTLFFEVIKQ